MTEIISKENRTPAENRKYYILLLILTISGAFNTIFLKLQDEAYDEVLGAKFTHPWFQSIIMFIAEFYCAIAWFAFKKYFIRLEDEERESKGLEPDNRPDPSIFLFIVPAMCDVIGSTLLNFALFKLTSSIFQMMRGGIMIITCLLTILLLRRRIRNYQWAGVVIAVLGLIIIGISSAGSESNKSTSDYFIGIGILLVSLLFSGFQLFLKRKL